MKERIRGVKLTDDGETCLLVFRDFAQGFVDVLRRFVGRGAK